MTFFSWQYFSCKDLGPHKYFACKPLAMFWGVLLITVPFTKHYLGLHWSKYDGSIVRSILMPRQNKHQDNFSSHPTQTGWPSLKCSRKIYNLLKFEEANKLQNSKVPLQPMLWPGSLKMEYIRLKRRKKVNLIKKQKSANAFCKLLHIAWGNQLINANLFTGTFHYILRSNTWQNDFANCGNVYFCLQYPIQSKPQL